MEWTNLLKEQALEESYNKALAYACTQRQHGITVYPEQNDVFNALTHTAFKDVKVVILGQDPYHGEGQAHGLCFSVKKGVPQPPSLKNIFKELQADLGIIPPSHGELTSWAKQGVFLLNTVLTVTAGEANSHKGQGWEDFTDEVIRQISDKKEHVVFLLWGAPAQKKSALIDSKKHTILKAPHPSPLSAHRGFLGCKHFSLTNEALAKYGQKEIDWKIL